MVIDKIRKMAVKGVELKSESFFLISLGVLELWRKNLREDGFPPRHSRVKCTFQILGGCQGRRTGVGVTTVSNSLILGGWMTKVLKNGDKK